MERETEMFITVTDEVVKRYITEGLGKDLDVKPDLITVQRITRHQGGTVSADLFVEDAPDGSA